MLTFMGAGGLIAWRVSPLIFDYEDQNRQTHLLRRAKGQVPGVPEALRRLLPSPPARQRLHGSQIHGHAGTSAHIQQRIADEDAKCLEIQWEDLESFFRKEEDKPLLDYILANTRRYIEMFSQAAEEMMPKRRKQVSADDVISLPLRKSR